MTDKPIQTAEISVCPVCDHAIITAEPCPWCEQRRPAIKGDLITFTPEQLKILKDGVPGPKKPDIISACPTCFSVLINDQLCRTCAVGNSSPPA